LTTSSTNHPNHPSSHLHRLNPSQATSHSSPLFAPLGPRYGPAPRPFSTIATFFCPWCISTSPNRQSVPPELSDFVQGIISPVETNPDRIGSKPSITTSSSDLFKADKGRQISRCLAQYTTHVLYAYVVLFLNIPCCDLPAPKGSGGPHYLRSYTHGVSVIRGQVILVGLEIPKSVRVGPLAFAPIRKNRRFASEGQENASPLRLYVTVRSAASRCWPLVSTCRR
jgi:hypothetical protein